MRLTLIHPAIGHRMGERPDRSDYIRTWQMEPLPMAALAAQTPADVDIRFHDDRVEPIPFDEPTDLVALSVETYTARRAYEIASEFRRRRIPVIMGGFHAMLLPEEVQRYAEAVVVGEAEGIWPEIIDDARHRTLKPLYRAAERPSLTHLRYDRSIFRDKRYLPLGLIEAGRGCRFPCDFCAIQTVFERTHRHRPIDSVIAELELLKRERKLFFFVDDNFAADLKHARELVDAIAPVGVRWVTQMSINAAHDEEFLARLRRSGCQGVLIGFESLDPETLIRMNKRFNTMKGGYDAALAKLRRHGLRVYGTFVFGYDLDTKASFAPAVDFALRHRFYLTAFNHLTPFPGTALYQRLQAEGRLQYEAWWLDRRYSYNRIPFRPARISAAELQHGCVEARKRFYSWPNMLRRGLDRINRSDHFMFRNFFLINGMHRAEVMGRDHFPLGDAAWSGTLLQAA
jgi:radical SAM superfamily enzyme YgiQ (UPF0313 family)